jgi:hypothetical protein
MCWYAMSDDIVHFDRKPRVLLFSAIEEKDEEDTTSIQGLLCPCFRFVTVNEAVTADATGNATLNACKLCHGASPTALRHFFGFCTDNANSASDEGRKTYSMVQALLSRWNRISPHFYSIMLIVISISIVVIVQRFSLWSSNRLFNRSEVRCDSMPIHRMDIA